METRKIVFGILMCVVATTSWGAMFPVMEHALNFLDPFYLTTIRYIIGAFLFLLILLGSEGPGSFSFEGRARELWILGTMGFAGFGFLVFWGQQKISGHEGVVASAVIMATMPLLAAIVTWLTSGKKPQPFTLILLFLAFTGVLLVMTNGDLRLIRSMGSRLLADLIILAGAFFWVLYTWGASRFPHWSPLRYTALSCALGTLSIVGITAFGTMAGRLSIPQWNQIHPVRWDLGYMILIAGILGVLAWNVGNRFLGTVNGVLFINLVPVVALGISAAEGESVRSGELMGSLLVIFALVLNNLLQRTNIRSSFFPRRQPQTRSESEAEIAGIDD